MAKKAAAPKAAPKPEVVVEKREAIPVTGTTSKPSVEARLFKGSASTPASLQPLSLQMASDPESRNYRSVDGTAGRTARITLDVPALQLAALELSLANPDAHRILDITADYVVGDGLTMEIADAYASENPNTAGYIEEHFEDPGNGWDADSRDRARDQRMFGEMLFEMIPGPGGAVFIGEIQPTDITEWRHARRRRSQMAAVRIHQSGSKPRWLKALSYGTRGSLIGLEDDDEAPDKKPFSGVCVFKAVNRITGTPRGLPDLTWIHDWLLMLHHAAFNFVERSALANALLYHIIVDTIDDEVVRKVQAEFGASPPPGSSYVTGKGVEVKMLVPDLRAAEHKDLITTIRRLVISGAGLAPHHLADPDDTNRSTGMVMDVPVLRRLMAAQRSFTEPIETALLWQGARASRFFASERAPRRGEVKVIAPPVNRPTPEEAAGALNLVAQAFGTLLLNGLVSQKAAERAVQKAATAMGVKLDAEEIVEKTSPAALDTYVKAGVGAGSAPEIL